MVFTQGTGRGRTGISRSELISWGLPNGPRDYDEFGDPDEDGRPTFLEYLRDLDPLHADDPRKSKTGWVEADGERFLAWTVATPVRLA